MGIIIKDRLYYVHAKGLSMILENRDGDLLLKHLGKSIKNYNFSNTIFEKDHAFSATQSPDDRTYSYDTQRQAFGVHGFGDFRHPSIKIENGNNELTHFKIKESHILDYEVDAKGLPNPHSREEAETLLLILEDDLSELELRIYYTAYEDSPTISTFTSLVNKSNQEVVIHRDLSAMFDMPASSYDIISLQGSYAREKTLRRRKVDQGMFSVFSNRGASGHSQTPAIILADSLANEDYGEAWALQLMYSGNFQASVEKSQLNEVRMSIGIADDNFAWRLKTGESFDTPVALLTYSDQGLTKLSQESQSFVQNHIMAKRFAYEKRPILINNWEATYFDFDKDKIDSLTDEASKLGIELFVLDDGWFGNRFDDNRALGDWQVNEEKIGCKLSELISDVHKKGMKFGLWVEPEMISVDSDLYRKHPDWAIQAPKRGHSYSRNQLVLNLANPEVVAYLKEILDDLLSNHDIDYIKWDYNRNITNIGNGKDYLETMEQSHRYMLGFYDLVKYLTENHSNVLFESCSGGGGRNDLGIMRYFPQVWASDNTDAINRLPIQYGSTFLYPTISMGAHVSASPNHQMKRVTPLKTRGHVAMMGNFGYELDLSKLSKEEKEEISKQASLYKEIRPIIQFGRQYRLINPVEETNEVAVEFVKDDRILVTYVRKLSTIEEIETTLKLKGLEEESIYRLHGTNKVYSGAELMYAGLTIVMDGGDFLSKQYYFTKIEA